MSNTKQAAGDIGVGDAMTGLAVPLAAQFGTPMLMGRDMEPMPNQHVNGGAPQFMYRPTAEATRNVQGGKGSMVDHMRAYRHPGQVQNHPLYGLINKFGPGVVDRTSGFSNAMFGQGARHGALAGAGLGAGTGLAFNAIMALLGRSEFSPIKSTLVGAGVGAGFGAGAAAHRDWRTAGLNKAGAQVIDVDAEVIDDEEETDESESKDSALPAAILAGLGGATALGSAYAMSPDALANRAKGIMSSYDPEAFSDSSKLPKGHTDLTYYQKMLSPAAQLTLLGKPVGDAMVKIRSNEEIMKRLGTESFHLKDPKAQEGNSGRQHYDMFARGPVAAYAHQMKAKYFDKDVPAALGGVEGIKYTDWMGRKFEDFTSERAGQRINPFEVTTKFMPHEEQNKLMEDFHASLSPKEQAFRLQVEDLDADKYVKQTGNYMPKAQGYLTLRDKLKQTGATLGGAGLGAGVGHALHDLITDEDEDGKHKRDWKYWLATLGGAAAGGFAGNRLINNTMKSAAWRSPSMDPQAAQANIQAILNALRSAPGLSFNQQAQLMSGVGRLDAQSAAQLRSLLGTAGGAGIGALVARFLMGKGLVPQVMGALLGGVIGNAVFGNHGPHTFSGNPGLIGTDLAGRSF